jgi:sulfatase maturation enzyme AslB (radical SAM superfamily)
MSYKNIDKGIEFMMCSPNPYVTMEFQGGESLLAFPKIKYAVEKSKELNKQYQKQIDYVICTNLSFINDEMLEYCKTNNILISTSLDGPEFVHNENRRKNGNNSYQIEIAGIKKCKEYLGEDRVSAFNDHQPLFSSISG